MRSIAIGVSVLIIGVVLGAGGNTTLPKNDPAWLSAEKGAKWLVSVQGKDGGWGQDGGETSYVRVGERLESRGNDVANTAVAALALMKYGNQYRASVDRAVEFILQHVEQSPADGLAVTSLQGTQIQRKLGPYIDTFLTSMLLGELVGTMPTQRANARVRAGLEKCVAKIERNQQKDGSWNLAGGWAPILGTSMASRSLYVAQQKGVRVDQSKVAKAQEYAKNSMQGGVSGGVGRGMESPTETVAVSAGVPLYQAAQAMEQLSRTEADRKRNAKEIGEVSARLSDARFLNGFGSMGGEEFFSYLNISDSLKRTGGEDWKNWNTNIKSRMVKLQNDDGTWAGHHCITGRVAVTSAAILTLLADHN